MEIQIEQDIPGPMAVGPNFMCAMMMQAIIDDPTSCPDDDDDGDDGFPPFLPGGDDRCNREEEKVGLPKREPVPVSDVDEVPAIAPMIDPECAKGAAKVAVGVGGGYVIYRCIRLLPSLAPPLWPTLPPNLATPKRG